MQPAKLVLVALVGALLAASAAGGDRDVTRAQSNGRPFVAFGPQDFVNTTKSNRLESASFSVLNPNTTYTLRVDNGGASGQYFRTLNAIITLNGQRVIGPSDFSTNATVIRRPVTVGLNNQLTVTLAARSPSPFGDRADGPVHDPHQLSYAPGAAGQSGTAKTTAILGVGITVQIIGIDNDPPTITAAVAPPPNSAGWNNSDVTVTFTCSDQTSGIASCPSPVTVRTDGANQAVSGTATDKAGNSASVSATVNLDKTLPAVSIASPADGSVLPALNTVVTGTVSDALSGVAGVTCNNTPASVTGGTYTCNLTLTSRSTTIAVRATDLAGNVNTAQTTVTVPPIIGGVQATLITSSGATITWTTDEPADSQVDYGTTTTYSFSTVPDTSQTTSHTVTLTGLQPATPYHYRVDSRDAGGYLRRSGDFMFSTSTGVSLPPDPGAVAPPVRNGVTTLVADSTSFLYTGDHPIQTGVTPGTIAAQRAAVIRGTVLTGSGGPLSGVTVTILNSPQYGMTETRLDGMFDLAVNGGGPLTIDYRKAGFLPAQRQVQVPWQDFVYAPDVALVPADLNATTITLAGATTEQVARGSVSSDNSGNRQATLLFAPGTQATMTLPDGSTRPLGTLTVRATEYTVGPNGPLAMPAQLPPDTGYTYAVEYSADEALAAGATSVSFNQPVISYLENFLNFPVGGAVPIGFYDRQRGVWLPSDNGLIVKVLAVAGGVASLDVDGSGNAAGAPALAALGITTAELQRLATLYHAGQSLWRMPIPHFTGWDANWGVGPPPGATRPNLGPRPNRPLDAPCETGGSVIECENQILGEDVPIAGTAFDLHYRSDRTPGRADAYQALIPLTPPSSSDCTFDPRGCALGVHLQVEIAGELFKKDFSFAPNQQYLYTWDGKDAYGRPVQGQQQGTVTVGYDYNAFYQLPALLLQTFGYSGNGQISGNPARTVITLMQSWPIALGPWDERSVGLGGWSIDAQQVYDPWAQVLYSGDGTRRSAASPLLGTVITTFAGTAALGNTGDGGPAGQATLTSPRSLAVGPDGSVYVVSGAVIRRVKPDGTIATVAGNGQVCQAGPQGCGEGLPATQVALRPIALAIGPDGSLYFIEQWNFDVYDHVRRVGPDGIVTTIAGIGTQGYNGDGIPATQARLSTPRGIAIGADGTLYIADSSNQRIRRVGPDGIIQTIAGTGETILPCQCGGFSGDGGPATKAHISYPGKLALGPDGSLYLDDRSNARIRRIATDGTISTVAGNGQVCGDFTATVNPCGDSGLATQAPLVDPNYLNLGDTIAVGPDGSLYMAEAGNQRLRVVGVDGTITTLAGLGRNCTTVTHTTPCGDGGPATAALLADPIDVALGPDGSVYEADSSLNVVRRIAPALPGASSVGDLFIPSADGNQVYHFTNGGRHLSTLHALTGGTLYSFSYDAAGHLSAITDGDGNVTTISHDGAGNPTGIVAPFGQRTTLTVDGHGFLAAITNPAAETFSMTSQSSGLLSAFTDPRGNSSHFTYDALGRLTEDDDPVGGFTKLSRVDLPPPPHHFGDIFSATFFVTETNALGDSTIHRVTQSWPNTETRSVTYANHASSSAITFPGGRIMTDTRGVQTTETIGPDPRWGMAVPVVTDSVSVGADRTSDEIFLRTTSSRSVTVSNPLDPLTLLSQSEALTINGRTSTMTYSATGRTITVTDPAGLQTVSNLDALGRSITVQTTNMAPVQNTYDAHGRLVSTTEGTGASGRTSTVSYNAAGYPAAVHDPLGGVMSHTYDAVGRELTQTLPTGQVLAFAYDAAGNQISDTDAQGVQATYEYDAYNRLIAQTIDPTGRAVRSEYHYDLAGNLTSRVEDVGNGRLNAAALFAYIPSSERAYVVSRVTNATGRQTSYTYTPFAEVQSTTDPLGHTATIGYTPQGWPATVTTPLGLTTTTTYNSEGQPVTQVDPRGVTTSYTYDAVSRLHSVSVGAAPIGNLPALNETTTYAYDINSRIVGITDARGNTSTRSYDAFGRSVSTTDPTGRTVTATYDALNRVTLRTTGAGVPGEQEQTAYTYDAGDRVLTTVADPNGLALTTQYRYTRPGSTDTWHLQQVIDPKGNTTQYHYNALGLRDQLTDALNHTWTFGYDNLGRMTGQTDPLGNTVTTTVDALGRRTALTEPDGTERWSYNGDGTVGSHTDLAGRVTTYTYDADGRRTGITYPAGTAPVAFAYDASGNVVGMTDGLGGTAYTYDAGNRAQTRTRAGRTVTYSYNATDQVTGVDYWGNGAVQYGYDAAGRVTSLTPFGAAPTTYAYRSTGLPAAQARGNGVTTAYGYDSAQRITSLLHQTGGTSPTTLQQFQYTLDANGNRTQLVDNDGTTTFAYDALDRLTQASYPALAGGPPLSTTPYAYDANGNRLSDGVTAFTYDGSNRLSGGAFTYDAAGNLTSDGTTTYAYDGANRLVSTTKSGVTTTYGYDGWGNLARETVNGVTTDLVLDEFGPLPTILGEERSDGSELLYAYGPEGVTAQRQSTGGSAQPVQYPLLDGLGSVRNLVDQSGAVVRSTSYDAFGAVRASAGTAATTLGYTGERMGSVDGTVYLRSRFYQPLLGRFLQRDSVAGTVANPQSLNRYAYAEGNPTARTDPAGTEVATAAVVAGATEAFWITGDTVATGTALEAVALGTGSGTFAAAQVAPVAATELGLVTAETSLASGAELAANTTLYLGGGSLPTTGVGGAILSVGAATGIGLVGGATVVGGFALYQKAQGWYYGTNEGNAEATITDLAIQRAALGQQLAEIRASAAKPAWETNFERLYGRMPSDFERNEVNDALLHGTDEWNAINAALSKRQPCPTPSSPYPWDPLNSPRVASPEKYSEPPTGERPSWQAWTRQETERILNDEGPHCPYCGRIMDFNGVDNFPTLDHVIPWYEIKQGAKNRGEEIDRYHNPSNLIVVCSRCNSNRSDSDLLQFRNRSRDQGK